MSGEGGSSRLAWGRFGLNTSNLSLGGSLRGTGGGVGLEEDFGCCLMLRAGDGKLGGPRAGDGKLGGPRAGDGILGGPRDGDGTLGGPRLLLRPRLISS